jgi:GxxExxY protein
VHRALGPGLLESAYQACLAHELSRRQRRVECEVAIAHRFEGVLIEAGYRIDMRIDQLVLVENKTVEEAAGDLSQVEWFVFWFDYQLERNLTP